MLNVDPLTISSSNMVSLIAYVQDNWPGGGHVLADIEIRNCPMKDRDVKTALALMLATIETLDMHTEDCGR